MNEKITKKRWQVLVACCLINLCAGSLYAWSVFSGPMATHLSELTGTQITSLSLIFTVANSVGPITMITGGFFTEKLGPRWVIFFGGLLFGAGMLLSGSATSVPMLMLTYGICLGLGVGFIYGCTVSTPIKFFPDKKGMIGGITVACYGSSSVLVPPIANFLMERYEVTAAFRILGVAMMLIICVAALFVMTCPADFVPTGYVAPVRTGGGQKDYNWSQMLRMPVFYVMLLMLCCGAVSGMMIISSASPVAQRLIGMSAAQAATTVSVLALFNAAGRIVAGTISDKIGVINTIRVVFVVSMVGLGGLYLCQTGSTLLFYGAVCLVGLSFGSIMGVYPGFSTAQFGARYNTVNYGIMFIGFAAAGYVGPTILSSLYAGTGTDKPAFIVAACLSLGGLGCSFLYEKLKKC